VFPLIFQAWQNIYLLIVLPFILLFPDVLLNTFQKVFFPNPADVLMRHYK
jgi:hypothetical protein